MYLETLRCPGLANICGIEVQLMKFFSLLGRLYLPLNYLLSDEGQMMRKFFTREGTCLVNVW